MALLRVHALESINTSIDSAINSIIDNNVIKLPRFRSLFIIFVFFSLHYVKYLRKKNREKINYMELHIQYLNKQLEDKLISKKKKINGVVQPLFNRIVFCFCMKEYVNK